MSQRQSDEYPEHLNPFKKRSGIRGSFRQLKSNISRTFRKKDKEHKVELRTANAGVSNHQNRQTVPAVLRHPDQTQEYTTPALPRSRFNERLAKSKTLGTHEANPFNEEPHTEPVPNGREYRQTNEEVDGPIRKHRRKKRAPLPPNRNGENGFLNVPDQHGSQWSVNSGDTDISSSNYTYYSETDLDIEPDNPEIAKNIQNITKEIENYYITSERSEVEKNEAVTEEETIEEERREDIITVPNLVVSTDNGVVIEEVDSKEDKAVENCDNNISKNNIDNKADKSSEDIDIVCDQTNNEVEACENMMNKHNECREKSEETPIDENACTKILTVNYVTEENKVYHDEEETEVANGEAAVVEEQTTNGEDNVVNITIVDDQNNNSSITNEIKKIPYADAEINYCQIKSIYITGSRDDLDNSDIHYNESKSISISGSCDNILVATNNKHTGSQENITHTHKIRKDKLSKEVLLGSVENL